MLTLMGIQRKSGTYEGRPYDNIVLHCLDSSPFASASSQLIGGQVCEMLKISVANLSTTFGGLVSAPSDLPCLIGSALTVGYDRFGRPCSVSIDQQQQQPKTGDNKPPDKSDGKGV